MSPRFVTTPREMQQRDAGWAASKAFTATGEPRPLDAGWRERHIRWVQEGRIPLTRSPLLFENGEPVHDRRGIRRTWSQAVADATQPGRSSHKIARDRARAEAEASAIEATRKQQAQVQPCLRPPHGRLFAADAGAMLLRGPAGGIGVSERLARTLAPLSPGGRHPVDVLRKAGGWADEATMRAALAGIAGKLTAIGVALNWRRAGVRMAKARSVTQGDGAK